jgi:hypothetical protein
MATRALIGFITLDPAELIATYNHYDGYPENLGLALENHYDDTVKAKQIAEYGYISYIDPETGNIDAARKEAPSRTDLMVGWEDAMYEIAKEIDSFGANYAYIWNEDESSWVTIKHYGVRSTMDQLANALQAYQGEFGDNMADLPAAPDQVAEDYSTKWKNFLNENTVEKVMSQAMFKLQDEPKEMLDAYKASLANDIRLNGQDAYADYSVEDFIEDYENYIADKMDL